MSADDRRHHAATKAEVTAEGLDWPVVDMTGKEIAVCRVCWFSWPCDVVRDGIGGD